VCADLLICTLLLLLLLLLLTIVCMQYHNSMLALDLTTGAVK
jgi:hypothetical protein